MKKRLLIAAYLMLAISLAGCSSNGQFVPMEYSVNGDQVRAISIDVRDRKIDIGPSSDGLIYIDYYESNKEGYDIELTDTGILAMTSVSNKDWTDFIGVKPSAGNRVISIRIPAGELDRFSIKTTNEDVSMQDLSTVGEISISSNGGNIRFENLNAENSISLNVKNGDINGSIIGGYSDFSIHCDIKKGNSNLPNIDGGDKTLDVSCNNGDVNISFEN